MLWRRWRVWYGYNLYLIWKHYSTYTSNSTHFCGLTLPVGYNSLQVIKSRCAKSIIALMKLLVNNFILQTIKKKLYIEMHLLLCATSPESAFFLSFFQVINSSWLQLRLQTVQDSWRLCWGTRYEALRTWWTETETFLQTLVAALPPAASGITAGICSLKVSDDETTANMYKVNKFVLTRLLRVSLTLFWWILLSKKWTTASLLCENCCLVTSPHPLWNW